MYYLLAMSRMHTGSDIAPKSHDARTFSNIPCQQAPRVMAIAAQLVKAWQSLQFQQLVVPSQACPMKCCSRDLVHDGQGLITSLQGMRQHSCKAYQIFGSCSCRFTSREQPRILEVLALPLYFDEHCIEGHSDANSGSNSSMHLACFAIHHAD